MDHDKNDGYDVSEHETHTINVCENETFLDDGNETVVLSQVPCFTHDPDGDAAVNFDDTIGHR